MSLDPKHPCKTLGVLEYTTVAPALGCGDRLISWAYCQFSRSVSSGLGETLSQKLRSTEKQQKKTLDMDLWLLQIRVYDTLHTYATHIPADIHEHFLKDRMQYGMDFLHIYYQVFNRFSATCSIFLAVTFVLVYCSYMKFNILWEQVNHRTHRHIKNKSLVSLFYLYWFHITTIRNFVILKELKYSMINTVLHKWRHNSYGWYVRATS